MTRLAIIPTLSAVVLLAGCGSSSSSVSGPQGVNPAVEITVSFAAGATTPTDVKAFTPASWHGNLCSPSSLQFVGQVWSAASDAPGVHIYVNNSCSAASNPTVYVCTPAGATRATDGLAACAVDPTTTNVSAFSGGSYIVSGGIDGPFTNTANVTFLVVFYCASGDALVGPPAVAHLSCQQL